MELTVGMRFSKRSVNGRRIHDCHVTQIGPSYLKCIRKPGSYGWRISKERFKRNVEQRIYVLQEPQEELQEPQEESKKEERETIVI